MLLKQFPTDSSALNNLAVAYFFVLNFAKAQETGKRALELYPRNVLFRNNYALYAMYAGDFDAGHEAIRASAPRSRRQPVLQDLSAAGDCGHDQRPIRRAAKSYAQMANAGPAGASLASTALADLAVYRGHYAEAEEILKTGIQADTKANNTGGIAAKRIILAELYAATGRLPQARATLTDALTLGKSESILVPAARIFRSAKNTNEASDLAADLDNTLQTQNRAYAKIIDGNIG